ncbi:MAG: aromatic ring-hydroxylating dioxygenase subunit alpha [Acidobacteria bacterium]|nr:aromatic ring-hydroxylating dioxygenase subunit alpha [Acidobacteriota bacterium]
MSDAAAPTPQTPDAEMLLGFWYPALRSPQVSGRKLHKAMLLGVPLVVGRTDQGQVFALRDTCPHRSMPLSDGQFDGAQVECCYHGWRFEATTGQCREIPSLVGHEKLKVERIHASSFPCEEADGYVWVYLPDPATRNSSPPPVPRLPVFSQRYRITHLAADLPSNVDHGIIGLMDPAHGPFVHQSWWWRSRRSIQVKEKTFEPIPNGFRIQAHSPSPNSAPYKLLKVYGQPTTTIEFVLPNMRFEQIRAGDKWFSSRATVTPIERNLCRIDVVAAWNIFPWFPFAVSLLRLFGRMFIEQDRLTMEKQAVGLRHSPTLMLVDDADRPAKWYFQLKAAHLEARRTGRPMEHPLKGPVTLRWRS